MTANKLPGLNIQAPWAQLLLTGAKTIETRTYPLPSKYAGKWMWIIETPGNSKGSSAKVIGKIKFSGSKLYKTAREFYDDYDSHRVSKGDPNFHWQASKPKHGWIVEAVTSCKPFAPPVPRGIVYAGPFARSSEVNLAKACRIPSVSVISIFTLLLERPATITS